MVQIQGVRQKSTAGTVQNVHPCTFCTYVFAGQTRYWLEPPPSLAELVRWGLIYVQHEVAAPFPLAFWNRRCRYKARAKINRRHGTKCTSVYILYLRVCRANTLLRGTTAIRGGFDTLRIFRSGTDAACINQQRCFAIPRNSPLKVYTDVHF